MKTSCVHSLFYCGKIGMQDYIYFRHTTLSFGVCIHYIVLTTVSLVTIHTVQLTCITRFACPQPCSPQVTTNLFSVISMHVILFCFLIWLLGVCFLDST